MEDYKNKIYARLNEKNIVIKLFSSVFETATETDKLIEEGNEDYHAHVHLKYKLTDEKGRYNYKYENYKMILLREEEKEKLFPPIAPQPDKQQVLNAKLLQDNAEINIELEKQKQLNAQVLLQLAGGNTNV